MRLKTETHFLFSDCRWAGFKEELYLVSHSLGQVRHWVTLAPFWVAAELLCSSACCSWYAAAFPDPEQDGSCHSPHPVSSLGPSRAASGEVRSPAAAVPPPPLHAVSRLLGTGCLPEQDVRRGNIWGSCAEVHGPKFYPNKTCVPERGLI